MASSGGGLRDETNLRPFCELCGALENLKLCSGCRKTYYCNRQHQLNNWKKHKHSCSGKRPLCGERRAENGALRADDIAGGARLNGKSADSRCPGQSRTHHRVCEMPHRAVAQSDGNSGALRDVRHEARNINTAAGIQPYITGDEPIVSEGGARGLDDELESVGVADTVSDERDVISTPMRLTMAPDPSNTTQSADIGYHVVNMRKTRSVVDCPRQDDQSSGSDYGQSDDAPDKLADVGVQAPNAVAPERATMAKVASEPSFGTVRHKCQARVCSVENLSVRGTGARADGVERDGGQHVFKIPQSVQVSDHKGKRKIRNSQPANNLQDVTPIQQQEETKLADYVVKCLNDYGICVVDTFMGEEKGSRILNEVKELQKREELFHDGQTAQGHQKGQEIRGDKITWVEKDDPGLNYIGMLITRLDALMLSCSRRLGHYHINGRTKAMVACYPGQGKGYKCHVDNPNGDGRCVTCIYYINKDWDIQKHGGLLRIFPTMFKNIADIVPKFDRLLFFWSDRRNPHEVQPSFRPRLAITVWYFDAEERKRARLQYAGKGSSPSGGSGGNQVFEIQKNQ